MRAQGYDPLYMLAMARPGPAGWNRRILGQKVWLNVDGPEWPQQMDTWRGLPCAPWSGCRRAPHAVLADAQAIADRYARLYLRGSCSFIAYGAEPPASFSRHRNDLSRWNLQTGEYCPEPWRARNSEPCARNRRRPRPTMIT